MTQLLPGNSLGFLLTDVARLYRNETEKAIMDAGVHLTPGEIRALAHAARYGGSRQAALAERMGVEPMTLSAYLDRLEARGLIQRNVDPTDRRAKVITTTEQADHVFDDVRPVAIEVFDRMASGIDEEALKTTLKVLTQIRGNLTNDPVLKGDERARTEIRMEAEDFATPERLRMGA
ncbi:MarR family winged helix-turn-helix transcriptional regulator [Mangrovibrevibacter kandeliae]|uniref:MarR family winged helix-turn-helix transcriptional regulator n=1 Tax=Mangrovibrevibacter kandeliae TaxID=2968473 RepID=UPI0021195461|nr:MarR family transcriptional regulator [Aurantimonas sp. CSK15Z-1]MCQ8781907.1 MarR family transcriptional regulator [Aurantimonas sp. CSK15Z-1]